MDDKRFTVVENMSVLKEGDAVWISEQGVPKRVIVRQLTGARTEEHAVMEYRGVLFEQYVPYGVWAREGGRVYRRMMAAKAARPESQRDYIAKHYPEALPLLDEGWTVESALRHVEGSCDHEVCTGEHAEAA